jgi:predicted cupin superfamily sugar epimerase
MLTADQIITLLNLKPHPEEGGYFQIFMVVMPQLRSEILFSGSGGSLQRKLEAAHLRDEQKGGYL